MKVKILCIAFHFVDMKSYEIWYAEIGFHFKAKRNTSVVYFKRIFSITKAII